MTSNHQRESTADVLIGGAILGGFIGFVWGICLGLLVLGFQAYYYLRTGDWLELSALHCLKIVSFGAWSWLSYPRDWIGVHELLQNFPLSLFLVLIATLIGMIATAIYCAFEDPLKHLYNG